MGGVGGGRGQGSRVITKMKESPGEGQRCTQGAQRDVCIHLCARERAPGYPGAHWWFHTPNATQSSGGTDVTVGSQPSPNAWSRRRSGAGEPASPIGIPSLWGCRWLHKAQGLRLPASQTECPLTDSDLGCIFSNSYQTFTFFPEFFSCGKI